MPLYPAHPDKALPVPVPVHPDLAVDLPDLAVGLPEMAVPDLVVALPDLGLPEMVVLAVVELLDKPVVDSRHPPSPKEPHSRQNAPACNSFVRNSKASMAACTSVPALVPVTIHLHHLYPVHPEI